MHPSVGGVWIGAAGQVGDALVVQVSLDERCYPAPDSALFFSRDFAFRYPLRKGQEKLMERKHFSSSPPESDQRIGIKAERDPDLRSSTCLPIPRTG